MTEDEAREAVYARVGAAAMDRLVTLAGLVVAENKLQNLIAPATEPVIWARHILDSVQLLDFVPDGWADWLDIGTGGGFPGLAIAAASGRSVILVEPRRRRAEFLQRAARLIELDRVRVEQCRVEQLVCRADVISARAVAPLEKLLPAAHHCATIGTTWVLPRGQVDTDALSRLGRHWKGMFHVEPSLTHDTSAVIVARGVEAR